MHKLMIIPFLALIGILAEHTALGETTATPESGEQPAAEIKLGELWDSRYERPKQKVYYKCYERQEPSGASSNSRRNLQQCIGRVCVRVSHHQSQQSWLSCKNFTEPGDPKPGQCLDPNDGQMPGQTETICACIGNFCNGAAAKNGNHISLYLLLAACLCAVLCSCCSTFVGAVLIPRQ